MKLRNIRRRVLSCATLIGLFALSLSGCTTGGSSSTGGGGRVACTVNPHVSGQARWTVLVFMNAANNLQPDSLLNVAQMASVGSDANLNIIVQWKQANCVDCGSPSFQATKRYRITKHTQAEVNSIAAGDTSSLTRDELAPPANFYDPVTQQADMGDWRVLHDFASWGAANYPADHLMALMWDHGAGWRPTRALNKLRPVFRGFSEDNATNNEVQTWEIPTALAGLAQPVDLLAFDCSLMQMMEVAYEARNSARVLVGSEESPPGAGYRYDLWLSQLKSSAADPCTAASNIQTTFVNYYVANRPDFHNITQSIIDLSKMQSVGSALNTFGRELQRVKTTEATQIQSARNSAQHYAYFDNKDLYHYAALIGGSTGSASLKQAVSDLQSTLTGTNGAVITNMRGSTGQSNSNGLAVYVPTPSAFLNAYGNLALSKAGAAPEWMAFLEAQTR